MGYNLTQVLMWYTESTVLLLRYVFWTSVMSCSTIFNSKILRGEGFFFFFAISRGVYFVHIMLTHVNVTFYSTITLIWGICISQLRFLECNNSLGSLRCRSVCHWEYPGSVMSLSACEGRQHIRCCEVPMDSCCSKQRGTRQFVTVEMFVSCQLWESIYFVLHGTFKWEDRHSHELFLFCSGFCGACWLSERQCWLVFLCYAGLC